jgi:anti-sigma factor RsiW
MKNTKTNCTGMDERLADLLLDPTTVPAKVQVHVAECARCQAELAELKATMALLDTWEAPEPSPYFLSKLDARMREEREAAPTGWLASRIARMRAAFAYGSVAPARPLAAMALTVMLLIGGGTYLGVTDWNSPAQPPAQAAVVNDLQMLDNNAQLLDQLESISDNNGGD